MWGWNTNTCLRKNVCIAVFFAATFVLGAFAHAVLFDNSTRPHPHSSKQVRENLSALGKNGYYFINPLLECDVAEGMIDVYKENFRDELEETIGTIKKSGEADAMAVYFRDLNNGPTFGIGENVDFIPASLLKVPVMMSYLHLSEKDSSILARKLTYAEPIDLSDGGRQLIPPSREITPGETYTIVELIERTIRHSDNPAVALLILNMPAEPIHRLYAMLGVREDVLVGPGQLTVKEYAAFFRILFNASYLSRENSEYALRLLTKTDFENGLRAGVPSHIPVAHKFGEAGNTKEPQIHDCGIVYYPDHPYLLCVMSRGKNIANLEESIATVSRFVFKKIDSVYNNAKTIRE